MRVTMSFKSRPKKPPKMNSPKDSLIAGGLIGVSVHVVQAQSPSWKQSRKDQ